MESVIQIDNFEKRYPQGLLCSLNSAPEGFGVVYLLTNLVNDKVYVGQTWVGIKRRWEQHLEQARNGGKYYISKALRKHGEEKFSVGILGWEKTQTGLNNLESLWILLLNSIDSEVGYNSKHGGSTGKLAPKTIKRMSDAAHLSWENSERRENLSVSMKERWADPEFRKRTLTAMASPETKEKVSAERKMRYSDPEQRQKISAAGIRRYADPEERKKAAKIQEKRWENPEEREKRSAVSKQIWSIPGFRAKQSQAITEGMRKRRLKTGENKNMITPETLFTYVLRFAKRSEDSGNGTQYPTFRQITNRFHVNYDQIEDAVNDGQGREGCGSYFGVSVGVQIQGAGYAEHATRGEYQVEAEP